MCSFVSGFSHLLVFWGSMLFHVATVCIFLWLLTIYYLSIFITAYHILEFLHHYHRLWICGLFSVFYFKNNATKNILSLGANGHTFTLGVYLSVEDLTHRYSRSLLVHNAKQLSRAVVPIYTPTCGVAEVSPPRPSLLLGIVHFLRFCPSAECVVRSPCNFIFSLPNVMYLLALVILCSNPLPVFLFCCVFILTDLGELFTYSEY